MCNPALAVAAVGAAVSGAGMLQSNAAQQSAAGAIAQQNYATQLAQNQGFTQRIQAAQAQTTAQEQAMQNTLANETTIADTMRGGQKDAMANQSAVLGAENAQADQLRAIGDKASADLLNTTSAPQLQGSQDDWNARAAELLNTSGVSALAPGASDPNDPSNTSAGTGDPAVAAALARRAAQAASNIRGYGQKVAQVASYSAPLNVVSNAVRDTATGIMPAQQAEQLLRGGSAVRLAPSELQWSNAVNYGNAATTAAQQAGGNALQLAGLQYQNTSDIANLQQQDATTVAANVSAQAQANAKYNEMMGNVISGIGNLGIEGAGYYGPIPSFLKPKGIT